MGPPRRAPVRGRSIARVASGDAAQGRPHPRVEVNSRRCGQVQAARRRRSEAFCGVGPRRWIFIGVVFVAVAAAMLIDGA
jgi:ribosomal protein L37E